MTKKTSKGNKSTYALVGLLLLLLAIGLILLALINGKTQYFDNDNKETKVDSVTCTMSDFKYPIFENKDMSATKAVATIIGWEVIGETAFVFLFGEGSKIYYKYIYIVFILIGATISLENVFYIADIFNALMAFPNLIALCVTSGEPPRESGET